jgi:hypothetical protein
MEGLEEDKPKQLSKTQAFALLGLVVFLFSAGSYVWLRPPSPFKLLAAHDDLELPPGSKAVLWKSDEDGHSGLFELPKDSIAGFAERYGLKADKILTYELSTDTRCSKLGRGEFIRLNNDTGALEIQIGNEPCVRPPGSGIPPKAGP